jgi:flagellar hook-basal body complex protein FliE
MPIDPISSGLGRVVLPPMPADATGQPGSAAPTGSFGGVLLGQLNSLNDLQLQAADQSQALATGQATDVAAVVNTVEQAALSMQLAVGVRNKAVEAYQEIMRMQI